MGESRLWCSFAHRRCAADIRRISELRSASPYNGFSGGLHCASNRWISSIRFDKAELMRAWRFALIAYLSEAMKKNVLHCDLSSEQIRLLLATQYEREWNIFLSRAGSKAYWLKHDGRYIRRPPVAQH